MQYRKNYSCNFLNFIEYKVFHLFPLVFRIRLTSNDDDDDGDDDDKDKEKMQHENNILSQTSPDVPSLVSTTQPLSAQDNLELCPKENNQNLCGLDDSKYNSSIIDTLPKGEVF